MQKVTVKYQIGTYSGTVDVLCDEQDSQKTIIVKAKNILRKLSGSFLFGYQSFEIIKKEILK